VAFVKEGVKGGGWVVGFVDRCGPTAWGSVRKDKRRGEGALGKLLVDPVGVFLISACDY